MMLLKLYELNFEAFPQAVMSWFILYYVDLGGGVWFPGDITILSLTTSSISLVVGVMQWSLFSMKDEQSKSFSEKAKKVATLVSSAIVPVEVVLFYSLAFHYFQELALALPLLTLVSSYLSNKKVH